MSAFLGDDDSVKCKVVLNAEERYSISPATRTEWESSTTIRFLPASCPIRPLLKADEDSDPPGEAEGVGLGDTDGGVEIPDGARVDRGMRVHLSRTSILRTFASRIT